MISAVAALVLIHAAALPEVCLARAAISEDAALDAAAVGLERLVAGDASTAAACLERARAGLPGSGTIARDLAVAYRTLGRNAEALAELDRAIALGDVDPEALELRAILLQAAGRTDEGIEAARDADTWLGRLVAASLGDGAAAYDVGELTSEDTRRGTLATLVLAARAGARGDASAAKSLLESGLALAAVSGEVDAENAGRALERRIRAGSPVAVASRVRATVDHASNPTLLPDAPPLDASGVRLAFLAESTLDAPVGPARIGASLRLDQHVYLNERPTFAEQDLFGLTLAASVELPISRHPSAALIGARARFIDVFGDELRVHWASTIEGGPTLALPLSSRLRVELGIFGVATDYIDRSPANARISSQNRDLTGRRATLALEWAGEGFTSRTELMFLRDDATGDAFDARGGAIATRLDAEPFVGVFVHTGIALTIREYGPVGDQAIIGSAATRPELRTVVEVGAAVPITDSFAFVVEDTLIRSDARRLHGYSDNVFALGVEQRW